MSSKKEPNMFVFAAIICVACSLILTVAATSLRDRQQENIKVDKQMNILKAMALIDPIQKTPKDKVKEIYNATIQNRYVTPAGELVDANPDGKNHPVYVYVQDGKLVKYAIPTSGYGLWSWIYGFLAIEGDGQTVAGFSVYQHGETPGLGGECEKPWFLNQFIGKKITDDQGEFVSVGIVKGRVAETVAPENQKNYVDGMTGATITSKGLSDSLKTNLLPYETFAKTLRQPSSTGNL